VKPSGVCAAFGLSVENASIGMTGTCVWVCESIATIYRKAPHAGILLPSQRLLCLGVNRLQAPLDIALLEAQSEHHCVGPLESHLQLRCYRDSTWLDKEIHVADPT